MKGNAADFMYDPHSCMVPTDPILHFCNTPATTSAGWLLLNFPEYQHYLRTLNRPSPSTVSLWSCSPNTQYLGHLSFPYAVSSLETRSHDWCQSLVRGLPAGSVQQTVQRTNRSVDQCAGQKDFGFLRYSLTRQLR